MRKSKIVFILFGLLAIGVGLYIFLPGVEKDSACPASGMDRPSSTPVARTTGEPIKGPGAGKAGHTTDGEGTFSPDMTRLVNGIHAGRVVHVRVGGEEHRYLFRPTRITAEGFKISAGAHAEHPAAFEVFEGQQILPDGTLTGMAKLAVVNHTLSMAYATEDGDFLIEESGDGKWVARTLLSAEKGSKWGHFKCDEANGLAGIVDASGDSPEPPRQEVEIMLASEAESSTTPQVEGARVSHPYFRLGSQYDASLKDILVLMVSSKSQTGTNLSSKAATYFTYAATTADVYERQLGLRYLLQELVLIPSNSAEADIEPAVNNPNDNGSDDLSTLRTWCETHRPQATYGWGHAMGWTLVEGSGGGWIGWAWVDSYGSSTFAYSVNEPEWTWGVHVHELGHNVGASHTTGSGGAMNPSVSKSNPQEGFFTLSEGGSYTAATDIYNYMSSSSRNYVFGPALLRNPVEMPFGVDDAVATNANTPVTFNPLSNDLAATPLFGQTNTLLSLVEAGQVFPKAAGTARISGNQITFTPASGFTGNAWLTYTLRGNLGNGGYGWLHSADVVVTVGGSSSDPGQNPAISTTNDVIEADLTGPVRINPLLNDEGKGRLWAGGVDAVSSINGTAQSYSDAAFHLVSAQVIAGNGSVSLETASMTRNSTSSQGHTGYLVYTPGAIEPDLIEIQYTAKDANGTQSTGTIFFRKVDPMEIKATGTVIGTTGSYLNNPAWDKNKVFDGDLGTFYDAANANGDWAGLDLGTARQITRIRFAPRSTWPSRMVGGQFQGSNAANFSTGVVTFHTVADSPTTGVLTNVLVNNTGTYRYLRYIGPDGGFCNVAEVEFYSEAAPATPTGLAATVQGNGSVSLDWADNAEADLNSYRVYRSTISGNFGNPLATNVPGSSYIDSTAVNGTTYYYTVTAVDQEGYESGWSNQISSTLSVNSFAPVVDAGPDQAVLLSGGAPWTPAQLSPTAWYDASDAATLTQSGGKVSVWADKRPTGPVLSQGNSTLQPQVGVNTINGLPTVKFDGTDDTMVTATNPFSPTIQNALVIAVHRNDGSTAGSLFSLSGTSSNSGRWQAHAPYSGTNLHFDTGGVSGSNRVSAPYGVVDGDNILVSFYGSVTDNVQQVHKNGSLLVGDATGHSVTTAGNISVGSSASLQYQRTSIGEMIIINGTVSAGDRQKLEGYLAHKWGLAGSLPSNHPYKAAPPGGSGVAVNLDGTVSDGDGTTPTVAWSKVSGNGTVTFGNASAVDTTATFTQIGTYVLRLSADDGTFQDLDEMTVTVSNSSDSDGDGMNDTWEITHFGNLNQTANGDFDNDGQSNLTEFTNNTNPTANEAPPAAPTGLLATSGNGLVNLDWNDNAESDLATYSVYRSTTAGSGYIRIAENLSTSSYSDNTVTNETTYYYVVRAIDTADNESGNSNQQSATPTGGLLVSAGPGGLVYETYANEGQANKVNTVPDFSRAGYKGGGVEIPFVPAVVTLSDDGAADDTIRIQNAINTVSALPLVDGFRGAVRLQAGNYTVSSTLNINASGVVIRGAGQQETGGTTITYTATTQSDLFHVYGNIAPTYVGSSVRPITDAYVPVGATKLNVTNASPFAPGDMIRITNLVNQQWIDDIGMTEAGGLAGGTEDPAWDPAGFQLHHYRYVVAVNGTELTLDAPIVQAIETQYGGGEVRKYTYTGAIENVGIENIRLQSTYTSENDEAHGWEAIEMRKVRNGWVRQVTSRYFGMGLVLVQDNSLFVTVEDSACLDPKSITTGGRKYSFNVDDSTYNLVQRCLTRGGRHDFVSGSLTHGPNAFVDGLATQTNSDSGPHFRYATGQIYDNIKTDNEINVQNRLNSGTSHGWSGAQILFWNIDADGIICDAPTGAMNWSIGAVGTKQEGSWVPAEPFGIWQSENAPVTPRSLYYAQLEERLGTEALRNVVLPQQEAGRIWTEMQAWSGDGRFLDGVVCWIDDSAPVEVLTPISIRARIRDLGILENLSSTTWSKLSGPGNVTFGNAANLVTSVQFDRLGTYEIRLTADDGSRQVSGSFTVVVTDPNELGPPAAPTGLVATPGEESVSLDWNNNGESDLDFYRVYRSETPGSYGTALATTVPGSTYTDNTAVGGTTYYYVVTAVDTDNKESVFSNEVNATPTEPNLPPAFDSNPLVKANAEANTAYSSSVADDASDPNPDTLSFSKVSGPAWLTVSTNGTLSGTPASIHSGINEWALQVTDGQSGIAQTVLRITVNADTTAPNAPSGLTATPGDGQVALNWSDNSDPDFSSYTIYRATTTGGYTTALASGVTSSQYTDTTAVNGTTYYYVVRAKDADGNESSNGNESVATPTAVTEFTVAATDNAYIRAQDTTTVQDASQSLLVNRSSWTFGAREAFIRIPLSGDNAIGGYPVDSIDSVTLDLFATTMIPSDTVKVYALLDGVQFSGSHLAENTWTGGTAGTQATGGNLTPNNRPDGGGTMPKSGYTSASLGQITFSASPVNNTLQRITISNLTAFKDLIRNDTNGQITLVLVSSTNSPNNVFASVYNTSGHAVPKLTVGLTPSDVTPPTAPTGLAATPGNNSISLDWNDNAEGDLASYAVYRRETGGSYGTALATGLTSSTYVDASAVNGTEYFYVVRAVDTAANVSNASNEDSATPSNDLDGDGLDDAWETEYLGNTNGDGSGDMDGDGTTDFFEYLYGSDPDDNASRGFRLVAESGSGVGGVAFRWQVQEQFVLGTHYEVHISTNLTSWDPLPVEHYTLEQTSAGIRTQHELSLTHNYGNKVFIRLTQP